MKLNYYERRSLATALIHILKQGKFKTNEYELYNELEKSNSLNMNQIYNIIDYAKKAQPEELLKIVKQQVYYRRKKK